MISWPKNPKLGSNSRPHCQRGFSLAELLIAVAIVGILTIISVPYLYNYQRLYKSEDQALKIMDLMREANQSALNKRRTFRFEIDLTDNKILLIDENGSTNGTLLKAIPLSNVGDVRVDIKPTGIPAPNPPNYGDAAYAADTLGHMAGTTSVTAHNVWAARFRSDGSVVTAANAPVSATLYVWPPQSVGSTVARNKSEVRAVTMFGGSGAVRYWKYTGTSFQPY